VEACGSVKPQRAESVGVGLEPGAGSSGGSWMPGLVSSPASSAGPENRQAGGPEGGSGGLTVGDSKGFHSGRDSS
jgi:hypothetical protein